MIYDLNYCEVQVIQNLLHCDCKTTYLQRLDRAYSFARLISPHKRTLIHDYLEGWESLQEGVVDIINYLLAGQLNVVLRKIQYMIRRKQWQMYD